MVKIAIIGAGLSGLAVANLLQSKADISLFEKSRGVGGRIATRREEPYYFDHGAQFFIARSQAFQNFLAPMIEAKVIQPWCARFAEIDRCQITQQRQWHANQPHYVGVPTMSAIGKYLSQNLMIYGETKIMTMEKQSPGWLLRDQHQCEYGHYDWVISTLPAPQAALLIPNELSIHAQSAAVVMKSCFSLMLGFTEPWSLDFDAALVRNANISWISVNSSKPQRNKAFCLLIHSTNQWADQHFADEPNAVIHQLSQASAAILGSQIHGAEHKAIHGWRYANIDSQPGPGFSIDANAQIGVCGDWLLKGRVEAAFLSGYRLANHLLKLIN